MLAYSKNDIINVMTVIMIGCTFLLINKASPMKNNAELKGLMKRRNSCNAPLTPKLNSALYAIYVLIQNKIMAIKKKEECLDINFRNNSTVPFNPVHLNSISYNNKFFFNNF